MTTYRSVPVTTVERTLLDLADSHPAEEVGRLMDEALRRRLTTLARLSKEAQGRPAKGRRRVGPFLEALADRGIGYDPGANDWEREMDVMWNRLGLPEAVRQYRVTVAGGRVFRPDRAILAEKIAVDWNGYGVHGLRTNFDADSERRALLAAAGWFPLDFTSRTAPRLICQTVLAVYLERHVAPA